LPATFLLWLLSELFEELPEVGDPEKPKLVFFFDEAHLLFEGAPPALVDKVEQVVKLIRSKGVGVWFVTQNPLDIPESVLGQLALQSQTPAAGAKPGPVAEDGDFVAGVSRSNRLGRHRPNRIGHRPGRGHGELARHVQKLTPSLVELFRLIAPLKLEIEFQIDRKNQRAPAARAAHACLPTRAKIPPSPAAKNHRPKPPRRYRERCHGGAIVTGRARGASCSHRY
jgi:hypothetical protein